MGSLHKKLKKYSPGARLEREINKAVLGKKKGEQLFDSLHPMGTSAEKQYDATKAAEQAARDAANAPVLPLPDEEQLKRYWRRRNAARGGGRASTILTGGDSDTLGG